MALIKLLLPALLVFVFTQTNAQRATRRMSYEQLKQEMINTTVKLNEIRTHLNEKTSEKISITKTITFTQDSIVVLTGNIRETGTWIKGSIDFIITTAEGNQIKYDWSFGRTGQPCYIIGDDKKRVECYSKVQ